MKITRGNNLGGGVFVGPVCRVRRIAEYAETEGKP